MSADRRSIFHNDWWAEASNPGEWDKVQCRQDGEVVAEFTYVRRKRHGFWEVGMPSLADTMEPLFVGKKAKFTTQLSNVVNLIAEIDSKLPRHDFFSCIIPPGNQLELPYNLAGYLTAGIYTFRSDPGDRANPWEALCRKTRNRISGGRREFTIESHTDLDRFVRTSKHFLNRAQSLNRIEYDALERVFAACVKCGRTVILSAVNQNHADVAVAILVWDDNYLYFWRGARIPTAAKTSAVSLLIWSAIELASQKGLVFDMDGYASPNAGMFYAKFGLRPHRRIHVTRASTLYAWSTASRSLIKSLTPVAARSRVISALNQRVRSV